jgi:hypothetical protein
MDPFNGLTRAINQQYSLSSEYNKQLTIGNIHYLVNIINNNQQQSTINYIHYLVNIINN